MMRAEGHTSKDELGLSRIFAAGGLAGSFGWSVIMPFDVAKTRLQVATLPQPLRPRAYVWIPRGWWLGRLWRRHKWWAAGTAAAPKAALPSAHPPWGRLGVRVAPQRK